MIILDTNVLSETLRPVPNAKVMTWLAEQRRVSLFTTTVTKAEIFYGVRLLAHDARKASAINAIFDEDFAGRLLSFDNRAADMYAQIAASRKSAGIPISQFDAMIAAITRSQGATLATHNTKDFVDCGIPIIDPWRA
ncbi:MULTISPECIES: type II toxin-antitoxin system VapC family toxin [Mycetohabitans]|uniref:type II toxin-antitoxin system VapC family toxin n=1 Tax=Mycetohabitans TaxID=2571159 RepID=UPI001F26211A|nr:type II toxin-antitoxin system VapC family toxin [Mycetohabitans sp. B3]MCF2133821.1 type II toxin-antitoxin system VapC family toxin [Mycetohabitans sp. B3]